MHPSPISVLIKALYTIFGHHILYLFTHQCILHPFLVPIKALYTISCHHILYPFMSLCIFHPFWCQSRHVTPYPATTSYTYLSIIASFTHFGANQGALHHILPPNPIPIYGFMHPSPISVPIKALYTISCHHILYLFNHYYILHTFWC